MTLAGVGLVWRRMMKFSKDRSKLQARKHNDYLNRKVYNDKFGNSPSITFRIYEGERDACSCGCGEYFFHYNTNWLTNSNPKFIWNVTTNFARLMYHLIQLLVLVPRLCSDVLHNFDSLKERDSKLGLPGYRTSLEIQYVLIRTLVWPIVWVLLLASPLFLAFTLVIYFVIVLLNMTYVALSGTVFIIGAAISLVFDQDILLTLALVVVGIVWNYVEQRVKDKRRSEEMGALLALINEKERDEMP